MKMARLRLLVIVVLLCGMSVAVLAATEGLKEEAAREYQLGTDLMQQRLYSFAIQHLKKALTLYEQLDNLEKQAYIQHDIGTCCAYTDSPFVAISAYRTALEICKSLLTVDMRALQASILSSMANLYTARQNYEEAIDYLSKALELHADLYDSEGLLYDYYGLGFCHQKLDQYEEASGYYQEALVLCRTRIDWYSQLSPIILENLGYCSYALSKCSEAKEAFEAALRIQALYGGLHEPDFSEQLIDVLLSISICYRASSKFDDSIVTCEEALRLSRSIRSLQGEAASLNALGLTYMEASDYISALRSFQHSLDVTKKIPWDDIATNIGKTYNNIGNCYVTLGNMRSAYTYHAKALKIFQDFKLTPNIAMVHSALSADAYSLGNLHKAAYHKDQAAYYFAIAGMLADQVGALSGAVGIYREAGMLNEARQRQTKAEELLERVTNLRDRAFCFLKFGGLYCSLEDHERGFSYLGKALEIYQSLNDYGGSTRVLGEIAYWEIFFEDYKKGAQVSRQMLDSLHSEDTNGAFQANWRMAKCRVGLANLLDAKKIYETTINIAEAVRSELVMESLSKSYAGIVQELYQEYLDLIAEMGELQETLLSPQFFGVKLLGQAVLQLLVSRHRNYHRQ